MIRQMLLFSFSPKGGKHTKPPAHWRAKRSQFGAGAWLGKKKKLGFRKDKSTVLIGLMLAACGGDSKTSPPTQTKLFLRPEGEPNVKIYSEGNGLLQENADGRTTPIIIGTFDHDDAPDADDDNSDGIIVGTAYTLKPNSGAGYSNAMFRITENQLSFIGADSGDYEANPRPTYKLNVETTVTITIELPATFAGRINADASGDTSDADVRQFSFSGGTISKADKAAAGGVPAHRTIDVAAGEIYVADTASGVGKIISFDAVDDLRLPATEDIYEYYVIVTDSNNDGTGDVDAVAKLPSGDDFYVLGKVGAHSISTITFNGIKFTDKQGGGVPEIKVFIKLAGSNSLEIDVDGDTIIIKALTATLFSELLSALQENSDVTALVDITTVDGEYSGGDIAILTDFGDIKLSGGAPSIKAKTVIGGLTIEAATAGAQGDDITLLGISSVDESTVIIGAADESILIRYGHQHTLGDLINAIDPNTTADNLVNFVGTAGIDYDANSLLVDVLFALYSKTGADPTANETGTAQNGAYTWIKAETTQTDDYIINLLDVNPEIL